MAGAPLLERRLDLAATLDSIAIVQEEIEAAADGILDKGKIFRLNMSVEELVTNIVHHGGTQERIGVTILVTAQSFSVDLYDKGPAFDPFGQAPAPMLDAALEDRPIGGLGIHLVRKMVDRADHKRVGEHNHTRLTMLRTGAAADGGAA